ncbi:hypothetical protein UPYG_G00002940 [Umbra pygmaea]|uniref:RING-type E3 ubiquitin transferase n=1 Tax=Umbra pygmaea TaxID=75934 RepID=A0ABD0XY31_UMBPY
MSVPMELSSYSRDRDQAGLEPLQKQLICPICLDVFTKPVVILPCQHNLCRKCANELYQPSLFQVGTGGRFRCPSCRHEVVLDRHGVYGLQRNLLVENIIDVYKQESASSTPSKSVDQPTCQEHDGEKINIYCITCQIPSCSLCKVFGAHQTCQVKPLTEVYEQQKDELTQEVSCLVASNGRVQAIINELKVTCSNVEENCKNQRQMVCEKFNQILAILDERRRVMTQQITLEQEEKIGCVHTLVQSYKEQVEANTKLVETATTNMEEEEMSDFVESSKHLIVKVNEATSNFVPETLEPGYDNMDHYRVNFNAQERILSQLDFNKEDEEEEVGGEEEEEHLEEMEIDSEQECEPHQYLELNPPLQPTAVPEPVVMPALVQSPRSVLEPKPLSEPVLEPKPLSEPVLEPVEFVEPEMEPVEPMVVLEPVAVLEPVDVLESMDFLEPMGVLEAVGVQELEPVLALITVEEDLRLDDLTEELDGQAERTNVGLQKERFHTQEGLTTQTVTLFIFFLALAIMFQRLWAHIKSLACI